MYEEKENPNEYDDKDLLDEDLENEDSENTEDENLDNATEEDETNTDEDADNDNDDSDNNEDEDSDEEDGADLEDEESDNKKQPPKDEIDYNAKLAEKDKEIARKDNAYNRLAGQVREIFKKLDIKSTDVEEGLDRIAAEADGVTLEEYRKTKRENQEIEQGKALLKQQRLNELMANDLAALKKNFSDKVITFESVKDMPNFVEWAKLRDKGLSPEQAFRAVNGDLLTATNNNYAKQKANNDSKAHLKSVVAKNSQDDQLSIPKNELEMYREQFPNLSDKELRKLYNEAMKS